MNIRTIFLLIIFVASIKTLAQNTDKEKHDLQDTSIKVYFINGYGVIYQKYLSHNSFYRLQTEFELKLANGDDDLYKNISADWEYLDDFEVVYPFEKYQKNNHISVILAPEYGYNFINKSYVTLFFGVGPFFKYSYVNTEVHENYGKYYTNDGFNIEGLKSNAYSLGLIGFAGIESSINKNFKIFAEIELKAYRTWEDISRSLSSNGLDFIKENVTIKEWHYEFSRIKLGISILL